MEMTVDFGSTVYSDVTVDLANILGKVVYSRSFPSFTGRYHLNVSDLSDGVYLLKLKAGYREVVKRVVVKK
jgi:hypothetical protein